MAKLCKSRKKFGGDDNYHIFLNSVEGISKIIRYAGLSEDECKVVCSQRDKDTREKNLSKLRGIPISTTNDPVKTFNFYTSTCFEGQDIYDTKGRSFIVSEKYKDHTKLDVMTTIPQICGRLRDSEYNNEITIFYAESPYKNVTPEEFKASVEKNLHEAEINAEALDKTVGSAREILIEEFVNKQPYIGVENDRIVVDRNLANLEIVHYNIINGQYGMQYRMNNAMKEAGFVVDDNPMIFDADEDLEDLISIERAPFREIFDEYAELRKDEYNMNIFRRNRIEIEKPLVKEAYEKLGPEKVRQMKYHQSNIKRELVKIESETLNTKIFLMLDGLLPKQVPIPRSEIKEILENIYSELKINKAAKATEIKKWYDVNEVNAKVKGKMASCLTIVSSKMRVKK